MSCCINELSPLLRIPPALSDTRYWVPFEIGWHRIIDVPTQVVEQSRFQGDSGPRKGIVFHFSLHHYHNAIIRTFDVLYKLR
jgi:hypothetical protein